MAYYDKGNIRRNDEGQKVRNECRAKVSGGQNRPVASLKSLKNMGWIMKEAEQPSQMLYEMQRVDIRSLIVAVCEIFSPEVKSKFFLLSALKKATYYMHQNFQKTFI